MAGTAALGLFRELRTQPTRSRLRTSRRGQVEHRPVATSPASARPPRLAHSKRATSCRKGSSTRRPGNPRTPQTAAGASNPAAPPAPPDRASPASAPAARLARRHQRHHHRHRPGPGRDFSDDRPNSIRCRTARSWRSPRPAERPVRRQLPQLLAGPGQLRVLLPQLRVLPGQVIDSYRLLLDDFQRPRQQLLSGRSAGERRPGTIRACQNPGRRSHEPQQTLSSPANHAPRPACRSRRPRKTSHPPSQELRRLTAD